MTSASRHSERSEESRLLPERWVRVRLDEVCQPNTGIRDPRSEPDKPFAYVDISSVENISKQITAPKVILGKQAPSRARQVIKSGDVIVSTTRPNLNAVAVVPPDLDDQICSTGFCVLRPKENLDRDFLFAFVQTTEFVESLSSLVKGALYPAVTDKQVRSQVIPLPPLPEQRRIAAILQDQLAAVDRARAAAEEQLKAAWALPAAYLRTVFNSPEAQKWPRKSLLDECTVHPGQHILEKDYNRVGHGIGYLTGPADFGLLFPSVTKWTEEPKVICEPGDVLVTVKGAGVGKANLAPAERVAIGRQLMAIRPKPGRTDTEFVYRILTTHFALMQERALGSTVPGLSRKDIEHLDIPLPPIPEQRRIAALLSEQMAAAEQARQALQAQLDAINRLPAALLRRAFNGEL